MNIQQGLHDAYACSRETWLCWQMGWIRMSIQNELFLFIFVQCHDMINWSTSFGQSPNTRVLFWVLMTLVYFLFIILVYFGLLWFILVYFGLFWLYFEYFGIINSAFLLISWLIGWGLHCLVCPCWCMAQLAAAILWYKIQNCTHIMKTSTYYYHIYHIYITYYIDSVD
jgi:hypothetical protein